MLSASAFGERPTAAARALLVESLADSHQRVRLAAANALFHDESVRGRVIETWFETLAEDGDLAREAAHRFQSNAARLAEQEARLRAARDRAADPVVRATLRRALDALAGSRLGAR